MASPANARKSAADVDFSDLVPDTAPVAVAAPAPAPAVAAPSTGIGMVTSGFLANHKLQARVGDLEALVAKLENERGAQLFDPKLIAPSEWANRHEDSYATAEFRLLKVEIESAGGNVQPIMLRPKKDAIAGGPQHEVVFGHRRHRACLELGMNVSAVVADLDDKDLFVYMERENRNRLGLSAYEQGRHYQRAMDSGLFPSKRQLATAISRQQSDVVRAMQIAELPPDVIAAFPSPNDIQFRWAGDLKDAVAHHKAKVLAVAKELTAGDRPPAAEVFRRLTACLRAQPSVKAERKVDLGGGRHALINTDPKGHTLVKIAPGALPPEKWAAFEEALKGLMS